MHRLDDVAPDVIARAYDTEIQLRTGWTDAELAAQSPDTIERLRWRLTVESLWSEEAARILYSPLSPTKDAKANAAQYKAHAAAQSIHDLLFPKGD